MTLYTLAFHASIPAYTKNKLKKAQGTPPTLCMITFSIRLRFSG